MNLLSYILCEMVRLRRQGPKYSCALVMCGKVKMNCSTTTKNTMWPIVFLRHGYKYIIFYELVFSVSLIHFIMPYIYKLCACTGNGTRCRADECVQLDVTRCISLSHSAATFFIRYIRLDRPTIERVNCALCVCVCVCGTFNSGKIAFSVNMHIRHRCEKNCLRLQYKKNAIC